jgi:hypothetical protein
MQPQTDGTDKMKLSAVLFAAAARIGEYVENPLSGYVYTDEDCEEVEQILIAMAALEDKLQALENLEFSLVKAQA